MPVGAEVETVEATHTFHDQAGLLLACGVKFPQGVPGKDLSHEQPAILAPRNRVRAGQPFGECQQGALRCARKDLALQECGPCQSAVGALLHIVRHAGRRGFSDGDGPGFAVDFVESGTDDRAGKQAAFRCYGEAVNTMERRRAREGFQRPTLGQFRARLSGGCRQQSC